MKKNLFFLVLIIALSLAGFSQNCLTPGNLLSGKGTTMFMKYMSPNRIVVGGVYYTASQGNMTMAPFTLTPRNGDLLTVFAAVLDSNLIPLHVFNVIGFSETGGAFNDTRVWDMHADAGGNIYFCGSYTQDTLLSYFNDTIISDSYQEAFIIRCDTLGNTSLLKSCGTRQWNTGYKFEDRAQSICSDIHGNIVFTVSGEGSYLQMNNDTANSTSSFSSVSYSDIFIVSLFSNGTTRWIRNCGTAGKDDAAYDVDVNAKGEVSVCGGLNGSNSVFHFGQLTHTFKYSQYGLQGFVGKLDSSGVPVWLSPIEVYYPSGPDVGAYATAIDDSGYVYSSGYFDAWAIFNGDTIRSLFSTNNFFSKYSLSGQTEFVKLGNIDTFYPYPIYMDENQGKFLITGQTFTNQLTFQQYGQCCSMEAYAVVYNNQGTVQWLRGAKSVASSNPYFGMGCLNENGTAYVCGTGSGGTVEIAPLQIPINANNNYFVVKFSAAPNNGLSITLNNSGNDTISCGSSTQLVPTLVPANGPRITWWADFDSIASPNFTVNLNASPKMNSLYIATAFYNGCVMSDSIRIVVNALPAFAGNDTSICSGQALTLNGNALLGANYQWIPATAVSSSNTAQTNFSASQSTVLQYKVSRAGCSSIDTIAVLVSPLPLTSYSYSSNLLNLTFLSTALYADSISWSFSDQSAPSNLLNPTHTYLQNGQYNVCLHAFSSCGHDSLCQIVNLTNVGIAELVAKQSLRRTQNGYTIVTAGSLGSFALLDISGRVLTNGYEAGSELNLNLTSFGQGCYLLKLKSDDEHITLHKLLW